MWAVGPSKIHGQGVHALKNISKGTVIGTGIYFAFVFIPVVTSDFGSLINHSFKPNTDLVFNDEGDWKWVVVANRDISKEEEITLNYENTPWYIKGPEYNYI